jgi:transcriptional regulator with XRE-family HTH domain
MEQDRYRQTISSNLRAIRKSKGLTTVDLAKILSASQAKISYIENCKGVLSAEDIAVLSRRLNVPIAEFFAGLVEPDGEGSLEAVTGQLVRYGAVLLAKPSTELAKLLPFENVFARSLAFMDDQRIKQAVCTALIAQASETELHPRRIFAEIGNNQYLIREAAEVARLCLEVIRDLNAERDRRKPLVRARATGQIQGIEDLARSLLPPSAGSRQKPGFDLAELGEIEEFVEGCLDAKR